MRCELSRFRSSFLPLLFDVFSSPFPVCNIPISHFMSCRVRCKPPLPLSFPCPRLLSAAVSLPLHSISMPPASVSFSSSFLSLILFTQFGSVRLIYLFTFSHFIFLLPFLSRPSRSLDISFPVFLSGTRMDRCNFLSNYSFDFISYYILNLLRMLSVFHSFSQTFKHSIFK